MQLSPKFILIILIGYCFFGIQSIRAQALEGGYVSGQSITKGEKQRFYISSGLDTIDLKIFRLGSVKEPILTIHALKGGIQTVPDSVYMKGCGWNATAELVIPSDWKSGIYEADFPTLTGIKKVIFALKEKVPGSFSKVVVCLTVNTYQAYNNWGGKSLYTYNSTDKIAASKVSYDRPITNDSALGYFRWSNKLVRWLEQEHIPVEYCTSLDLDRDPKFLDNYNVYVTVGHDEYWSRPERNECQNFVNRGGRMMILSGNTCWWQVRHEDSLHSLVCYKGFKNDPLHPSQDSIVTCIWERWPVKDTENVLTGVNFDQGGYVNNGASLPKSKGYGGFTAYHAYHWIYDATNINDGDIFGFNTSIVGYETDGALFHWVAGYPEVTGEHKTPRNFTILGLSLANNPNPGNPNHTTMGYYSNRAGGAVFNSATTNWVDGLYPVVDPVVAQITRNVFRRFMNTNGLPPEILSYSPVHVTQDSINQESVFLGQRILQLNLDRADTFVVHAVDPRREALQYTWKIGENIVSLDSFIILTSDIKKLLGDCIGIKVFINNSSDTVMLDWALINSSIRFVSIPSASPVISHTKFNYKAKAVSFAGSFIKYEIVRAPLWLTIDSLGDLSGNVETQPGTYTISLRASDPQNNIDLQTFQIHITDNFSSSLQLSEPSARMNIFPNPFTSATKLEFSLEENALVTLEIIDVRGIHVRSIIHNSMREHGKYEAFWGGNDDAGNVTGAGTYFCRLLATYTSGKEQKIVVKLIKF